MGRDISNTNNQNNIGQTILNVIQKQMILMPKANDRIWTYYKAISLK